MRPFKVRFITTVVVFVFSCCVATVSFAQQYVDFPKTAIPMSSADEALHALSLTRFHFMTLKELHTDLFSKSKDQIISSFDAGILNTGLDTFLMSPSRETILLEALRQNKAVRLQFSISQAKPGEYRMVNHPYKTLLSRFEPLTESIPVTITIQPILDEPVAFHITLTKDGESHVYKVDWSSKIV